MIAVTCPPCLQARGTHADTSRLHTDIIAPMERIDSFAAQVRYEVAMPMSTDDVVYNIRLASNSEPADTLAGFSYLIDWTLPRAETTATGFLAYFNGHHYNYRDNRLREYHYEWDSIPFRAPGGGVHLNGQFVDLLPHSLARELDRMASDSTFTLHFTPDTLSAGRHVSVIDATQNVNGYDGRNFRLILDADSRLPLHLTNEYNPGSVSEQTVEVSYDYTSPAEDLPHAVSDEGALLALYPEVFEKFRESNYRIENLRSLPLPGFSLPTATAERYTRAKGDPFRAPTLIAIIDPQTENAARTVSDLRKAIMQMPRQIDLILAFTGSNIDRIEEIAGTPAAGETMLISARALARDCGTSVFPTVITVRQDGKVDNVILGFNNNLTQDVIQSLALLP